MKLISIAAIIAPSSISTAQESSSLDPRTNQPDRKIRAIGDKIAQWTRENLCNAEGKCLPAVDKPEGNWEQRIDRTIERLQDRYQKCGTPPEGGRKRRSADSRYTEEELYDLLYEDPEEETVSTGITPRFNKDDPLKGISQLCASIAKWVDAYLPQCKSKHRNSYSNVARVSLRMTKWRFLLENSYQRFHKMEARPLPSDWSKWFERKARKAAGTL
ncbi:Oidioi.mRNA.OKI2018_I69.PAR.g9469.t1.cds [Oikopleura dioica]|uniref:Oidioi.mRNA.OKI2018_I69.PAR.g9469.t1.cds n=1 Tax=Oikopleura dioica TaxID=34765 RepID=A0ABN7RPY8_OIKDI|nr:Oidioi.mRNA.OKI2018_I69.PAR.g9469.t1.cds [Oikopleura dioica]